MKKVTLSEKKISKNDIPNTNKDLSKSSLQDKRAIFLQDHFKNNSKNSEANVPATSTDNSIKSNFTSPYEIEILKLKAEIEDLKKVTSQANTKKDIQSAMSGVLDKILPDFVHEISSPVSILDNSLENLLLQYNKVMNTYTDLVNNESTKDAAIYIYQYTQTISHFLANINHNLKFRENKKVLITELSRYNFKNIQHGADHLMTAGVLHIDEKLHTVFSQEKGFELFDLLISFISVKQSFAILETAKFKSKNLIVSIKNYTNRSSHSIDELFDLKSSIDSALVMVGHRLRSRRFNFSYDASCFITGDIKKLSHIWINLLSNAIEASNSNGIINLNVFVENENVVVTVQDDGSGISEENLKNIYKADFTTKLNQEGIGMGLDFCKNYLESIDATIEVISKPGDTTFTVRFSTYANSIK